MSHKLALVLPYVGALALNDVLGELAGVGAAVLPLKTADPVLEAHRVVALVKSPVPK